MKLSNRQRLQEFKRKYFVPKKISVPGGWNVVVTQICRVIISSNFDSSLYSCQTQLQVDQESSVGPWKSIGTDLPFSVFWTL